MTATSRDDNLDLDARTKALDRSHVFHSWSAQGALDPLVVAGGLGTKVWDHAGNSWLDFSSQLVNVNIGYQHPKLVAAIQEQAGRLLTVSPAFANDVRSEAARLIAELAPGDLDSVFFTNGGAEATENAMLLVVGYTDSTGSWEVNQDLSEKRASRVVAYLQQQCGWEPQRMLTPAGMATSDPLADNSTKFGKAQNRRVAVNILVSKAVEGI